MGSVPCLGKNDWAVLSVLQPPCLLFGSSLAPECHGDPVAKRSQASGALERVSAGDGLAGRGLLGADTSSVAPTQPWLHPILLHPGGPGPCSHIPQQDIPGGFGWDPSSFTAITLQDRPHALTRACSGSGLAILKGENSFSLSRITQD